MRTFLRRFALAALLIAVGAGLAGVRYSAPARADARVLSGDPRVHVDSSAIEGDLATFLKAQGVTTNAGWQTFVTNLSAAQLLALEKARLVREITLSP